MTIRPPDSMGDPQIPPETLAALMEGTLTEDERAEVLRTLATSEADLDILADALAALGSLEVDGGAVEGATDAADPSAAGPGEAPESTAPLGSRSRRLPWYRRPPVWIAAAAVVALLWAGPGVFEGPAQSGRGSFPDRWTQLQVVGSDLQVAPPPEAALFNTAGRSAVRGDEVVPSERARAYRTGATLATLALAGFAGRDASAREALLRIDRLLASFPGGPLLVTRLEEVLAAGGGSGGGGSLEDRGRWEEIAGELAESMPGSDYFSLGFWVESARIEAIARPWPTGVAGPDGSELEALGEAMASEGDTTLAARVQEAARLLEAGAPAPEVVDALEAISAEAWGG